MSYPQSTPPLAPLAPLGASQMANPAATYCQSRGYRSEIRRAPGGGEYGVCIFPGGSECDEWKFFRGECGPQQSQPLPPTWTPPSSWVPPRLPGFMFGNPMLPYPTPYSLPYSASYPLPYSTPYASPYPSPLNFSPYSVYPTQTIGIPMFKR